MFPEHRLVGHTKTWFSSNAVHASPSPELLNAFLTRSAALGAAPFAVHEPNDFRRPRQTGAGDVAALNSSTAMVPIEARLLAYTPTMLGLEVDAPSDGWLLVTDRWAPGWRARVNGFATVVYPADFVFRAVYLKAGPNKITFEYRPSTLPPTLFLCWGTLFVIIVLQGRRGSVFFRCAQR